MRSILSLDQHCFCIGPQPPEGATELPRELPFRLGVHPRYAIPRLLLDELVSSALDRAYKRGSMLSTPLGESPLADSRMSEMIEGLAATLGRPLADCNLLEIGAGTGGLMSALRDRGAKVTGVEIGPQGKIGAERYGLVIVDRPFVPGLFDERFDAVYSYGCLEHLDDLDTFFSACRSSLREGGLMFHSVPNSELLFESGSLDHLAHEHINYFSAKNGIRLLQAQGFSPAGARYSRAGNELALWGVMNSSCETSWPSDALASETERLTDYANNLHECTARAQHRLEALVASGGSVGFYAGGYEYGFRMTGRNIRYFDGDTYKHGLVWLAGLPAIESPEDLRREPVDHLVIFKPHHFPAIVGTLQAMNIPKTRFWNIASFREEDPVTDQ